MYTNVVYFNYSKGKAAKNNADKAKTLVCGKVKNDAIHDTVHEMTKQDMDAASRVCLIDISLTSNLS